MIKKAVNKKAVKKSFLRFFFKKAVKKNKKAVKKRSAGDINIFYKVGEFPLARKHPAETLAIDRGFAPVTCERPGLGHLARPVGAIPCPRGRGHGA